MDVNLANWLTLARIFFVPVLILFLLLRSHLGVLSIGGRLLSVGELLATLVFVTAACTDGLDGYIARRRRTVTKLGKFLDPLADKLLVTAALMLLVEMGRLEAWIAIIIVGREFAVTGLRLVAAVKGCVVTANAFGKWKMLAQVVAIASLMLDNIPFVLLSIPFATCATWLAVAITVFSGCYYFYKNRNLVVAA